MIEPKHFFVLMTLLILNVTSCLSSDAIPNIRRTHSGRFFRADGSPADAFDFYVSLCRRGAELATKQDGSVFTVNSTVVSAEEHAMVLKTKALYDEVINCKALFEDAGTSIDLQREASRRILELANIVIEGRKRP